MKTAKNPTRKKRAPAPLKIYSMDLTPDDTGLLASLAQAATDQLGRSISTSAVLRAILRLVGKGMLPEPAIIEMVERELEDGRKWGKTSIAS